jgi:DNA/RNA-binding domain of Phe-tRNA-synthetase-like protein
VIEGLPPVGREKVAEATEALAGLVRAYCGGEVRTAVLDRGEPGVALM